MIPNTREEKVQWIQENLIPIFDSQLNESPEKEVDQDKLKRSKEILAEEYLDESGGILTSMFKLLFVLIIIDAFTSMPPQVYGLIFTTTGTFIILVEADILGSKTITERSEETVGAILDGKIYLNEEKARRLARNTVKTNIGLVWMFCGFLMQIIAVWIIPSGTMIQPLVDLSAFL